MARKFCRRCSLVAEPKILPLLLLFGVLCVPVVAQNLVANPSFERIWTCPYSYAPLPVRFPFPDWINPNESTPDIFHICSQGDAGVPENFAGYIYPHEGYAYAGIILRETFDDSLDVYKGVSREYIQAKFIAPLKPKHLYCVKLYYANASKSLFSVDALGITLTVDKISNRRAGQIIQMPQITNKPGRIMDNMDDWVEMAGIYRAKGGENYITIGNFLNNSQTHYRVNALPTTDTTFFYAYYYIDDVSVFEIDNAFECGCLNDNSYSSDFLAADYDPQTGYNTKSMSRDGDKQAGQNAVDGAGRDVSSQAVADSLADAFGAGDGVDTAAGAFFVLSAKSEITEANFAQAKVGAAFTLNRIFFEFASAELLPVSYAELDTLANILQKKPALHIEIRGHTDDIGSGQVNKKLSIARAAAVYNYLIVKGIARQRMKYRGFGSRVPVADNATDEGRSLNRRVEIIIVEM